MKAEINTFETKPLILPAKPHKANLLRGKKADQPTYIPNNKATREREACANRVQNKLLREYIIMRSQNRVIPQEPRKGVTGKTKPYWKIKRDERRTAAGSEK